MYRTNNVGTIRNKKKEYYEKNKVAIAEKEKIKYLQNRDVIRHKNSEKVLCSCGEQVVRGALSNHSKSKKHEDALNGNPVKYKGERVKCECGIEISKDAIKRHKNTKKHINLMENLPKTE